MKTTYLTIPLLILTATGMLNQSSAQSATAAKKVSQKKYSGKNLAILIFDGVQIIDYAGPYETFGHAYSVEGPLFNIYTVAKAPDAITTAMGMSVNPKYTFLNAPQPEVLVIPGGDVQRQLSDENVIKWVQSHAKKANITMSVCNGALILARAGLLDGLEATTTFALIPKLREAAPKTTVVDNKRYVDNGNIITTAGLSSGIDGSLHVIERLFGKGIAQMAALGMEYNWDPDSRFVRAALADKYMQFDYDVKLLPGGWIPLAREGGVDRWENKWAVTTNFSGAELFDRINQTITSNKRTHGPSQVRWIRQKDDPANRTGSIWHFTDENGNTWNGVVRVERNTEKQNQFILTVAVDRDKSLISTPEETTAEMP
jgi:putative intracellular protease/amidase